MIDQLLSSNVYQALVNASSPSAINPYITASVITSGYVPYIGATSNLNLGTFSLTARLGQFGAGTNSGRQVEIFQDSANVKIGSLVGTPTSSAIYLNQTTPSATDYVLMDDGASVYLNGRTSNSIYISSAATNIVRFGPNFQIHTPTSVTAGAITSFTFTTPANTSQTASTEISNFKVNGASKTWAAGAITNQRWNYFTANTAAFASASTITNSYGLYVEEATAGTNATITNNYALGLNGNISLEGGNRIIRGSGSIEIINGTGSNYRVYTGSTLRVDRTPTSVSYYNLTATSGAVVGYLFTSSSNTGQTASTNIPGFLFTTGSRQWATGAIATQEEIRITSPTYSFVGASIIAEASTLAVTAATAGTNATITNNFAATFRAGTATVKIGNLTGNTTQGTIYISQSTPSSTNYSITADSATTVLNGVSSLSLNTSAINRVLIRGTSTSGLIPAFQYSPPSDTGQTASTEISGYLYNSYSRQWASGAINTQRERYYKTVTYNFASASTITNAYGAYFEAPTAGTNATINNNWSLGTNGNLLCQGSLVSSSPSGGVGYFIGAGSTVTQITSRTTGVKINNVCGAITLVSAAGTTTWQSFTVTNSRVTATDVIIVNQGTGTDLYQIFVTNVAAGSFQITFATTGGTTTEQPVFNFSIIKAVTA